MIWYKTIIYGCFKKSSLVHVQYRESSHPAPASLAIERVCKSWKKNWLINCNSDNLGRLLLVLGKEKLEYTQNEKKCCKQIHKSYINPKPGLCLKAICWFQLHNSTWPLAKEQRGSFLLPAFLIQIHVWNSMTSTCVLTWFAETCNHLLMQSSCTLNNEKYVFVLLLMLITMMKMIFLFVLTFQSWHLRLYCCHLPPKITAETEITHPWIQNPHNCKNIPRSRIQMFSWQIISIPICWVSPTREGCPLPTYQTWFQKYTKVFVANDFHLYLSSISHQRRLPSPNLSAWHDMTQTLLLSSVSLNYSPQYYHPTKLFTTVLFPYTRTITQHTHIFHCLNLYPT